MGNQSRCTPKVAVVTGSILHFVHNTRPGGLIRLWLRVWPSLDRGGCKRTRDGVVQTKRGVVGRCEALRANGATILRRMKARGSRQVGAQCCQGSAVRLLPRPFRDDIWSIRSTFDVLSQDIVYIHALLYAARKVAASSAVRSISRLTSSLMLTIDGVERTLASTRPKEHAGRTDSDRGGLSDEHNYCTRAESARLP